MPTSRNPQVTPMPITGRQPFTRQDISFIYLRCAVLLSNERTGSFYFSSGRAFLGNDRPNKHRPTLPWPAFHICILDPAPTSKSALTLLSARFFEPFLGLDGRSFSGPFFPTFLFRSTLVDSGWSRYLAFKFTTPFFFFSFNHYLALFERK